jgi:hypothetical protein
MQVIEHAVDPRVFLFCFVMGMLEAGQSFAKGLSIEGQ